MQRMEFARILKELFVDFVVQALFEFEQIRVVFFRGCSASCSATGLVEQ